MQRICKSVFFSLFILTTANAEVVDDFPSMSLEPLGRAADALDDAALLEDELLAPENPKARQPQITRVLPEGNRSKAYFVLEYSRLVRAPFEFLKSAVMNFNCYAQYFTDPEVKAVVVPPEHEHSRTNVTVYKNYIERSNPEEALQLNFGEWATAFFEGKHSILPASLKYYLNMTPAYNLSADQFGLAWQLGKELQATKKGYPKGEIRSLEDLFREQVGAWYLERFQRDPAFTYVRYQLTARVKNVLPEGLIFGQAQTSVRQSFVAIKNYRCSWETLAKAE